MKRFLFPFLAAVMMATAAVTGVRADLPVLGKAPAWKLKDLQGKEVSSADFKGKVVVIDFWATWCPPCRAEIPGYIALQKKYAEQGLVILGFSVDEAGPEAVKKFAVEQKMNYTILMANQGTAAAFGGIEGIPTTFLIDREGRVRNRKVGSMDAAEYEARVVPLLQEAVVGAAMVAASGAMSQPLAQPPSTPVAR